MTPYAADGMAATVRDWFECADAFLLGRMTATLLAAEQRPEADRLAQAEADEGSSARTCGGCG